jgi:hypothetical protein
MVRNAMQRKGLRNMEPMDGFEPPTTSLQVRSSGQLSYIGSHVRYII